MTQYSIKSGDSTVQVDLDPGLKLHALIPTEDEDVSSADPNLLDFQPEDVVILAKSMAPWFWQQLRGVPRFVKSWEALWHDKPIPAALECQSRPVLYTVGAFFAVTKSLMEGKNPLIHKPETYYHPAQQQLLVSFFHAITGPL